MLSVAPSLAETWMSLSYLHIQLSLLQVEVLLYSQVYSNFKNTAGCQV